LAVGERGVEVDRTLRIRTLALMAVYIAVAVALIVLVFATPLGGNATPILVLPAGLLFGLALTSYTSSGAFDSDIVWVQYSPQMSPTAPPTDNRSPLLFELKIGAGSVVSRNWAGRSASGRNFKRFRAPNPALSRIPDRLAEDIEARNS